MIRVWFIIKSEILVTSLIIIIIITVETRGLLCTHDVLHRTYYIDCAPSIRGLRVRMSVVHDHINKRRISMRKCRFVGDQTLLMIRYNDI